MSSDGEMAITALRLMRLALPLLDRAGEDLAAARLQHAIDTVMGSPVGAPEAEAASPMLGDAVEACVGVVNT